MFLDGHLQMIYSLTYDEYVGMDFWLHVQGNNPRKRTFLYGDPEITTYLSAEEAENNMVSVQIPVWQLRGASKVSAYLSVEVHQAIADEIKDIFQEIFDDPEQFPVESIGGYNHTQQLPREASETEPPFFASERNERQWQ